MKRLICLFAALAMLMLCSCGEDEGYTASAGIWDEGGKLPYDYSLNDYIVLGDYNGIVAPEIAPVLYDEDIAANARAALMLEKTVDASVLDSYIGVESLTPGYIVKADIKLSEGGRECDITSEKDFTVIIDGGTYFESVSDLYVSFLAGKAAEEAVKTENGEASFVCPEYYADSRYAGKRITVSAKIKGVCIPALNDSDVGDALVWANSDYATLDELINALKDELSAKKSAAEKYAAKRIMWQSVVNDATILSKLPKSETERCKNEYISHYRQLASYNGCSYTEYIRREGLTESKIAKAAEAYAAKKAKEELVAFAIASEEGLLLSKSEFEEQAYKLAANMGYAGYDELIKYNSEATVYTYLTWEKASDFVAEKAVYPESMKNE